MTATIVSAIHAYQQISANNKELQAIDIDELSLSSPRIGNPITHKQLIALHDVLKSYKGVCNFNVHLDQLLYGSRLYKLPKANETASGTAEYESFIATLRHNEEARKYQQMLQSTLERTAIIRQSPGYSGTCLASNLKGTSQNLNDEDEMTFADLGRQVALIINVLVSVIACAVAIWVVSRWWDTPIRLLLSLSAGVLVAIAEVMVYCGYLQRLTEAKKKEKKMVERKKVLDTWVLLANDRQGHAADIAVKDRSGPSKGSKSEQQSILTSTTGTVLERKSRG